MKSLKFASAVVSAVMTHQLAGCGLHPVADWTDADVTDSSKLFEALSLAGMATSDSNESSLDAVVTKVVFGAHSQHEAMPEVDALLQRVGYRVAMLRRTVGPLAGTCPITGNPVTYPGPFALACDDGPLDLSLFDEGDYRQLVARQLEYWCRNPEHGWIQDIAGYYLASTTAAATTAVDNTSEKEPQHA